MSKSYPSICILYGLCEGRRVGENFENALAASGFMLTRDPNEAEIIVGHSGGCFVVSENSHAKLVVLIGLPFWPGKSTFRSLSQKILLDLRTRRGHSLQLLHKTFWNIIYFWNMKNNFAMLRGKQRNTFQKISAPLLVLRNQDDPMCTPDISELGFQNPPTFLSIDGPHDDCWVNPEKYLAIIKAYYGRILA